MILSIFDMLTFKGPSGDWQEVHVLGKKDLSTFCNLGLVSCDHF